MLLYKKLLLMTFGTTYVVQNSFTASICIIFLVKMHKCDSHYDANCECKLCKKSGKCTLH